MSTTAILKALGVTLCEHEWKFFNVYAESSKIRVNLTLEAQFTVRSKLI